MSCAKAAGAAIRATAAAAVRRRVRSIIASFRYDLGELAAKCHGPLLKVTRPQSSVERDRFHMGPDIRRRIATAKVMLGRYCDVGRRCAPFSPFYSSSCQIAARTVRTTRNRHDPWTAGSPPHPPPPDRREAEKTVAPDPDIRARPTPDAGAWRPERGRWRAGETGRAPPDRSSGVPASR